MYRTVPRPRTASPTTGRSNARPSEPAVATGSANFWSVGSCATHDPDFFFPPSHGGRESKHETAVKRICAGCPVLASCRTWVAANPKLVQFGVWAGTTEHDRRVAALKAVQASEVSL